jgi:hypothetical protein
LQKETTRASKTKNPIEAGNQKPSSNADEKPKNRKTEKPKNRKTEKPKNRKTEKPGTSARTARPTPQLCGTQPNKAKRQESPAPEDHLRPECFLTLRYPPVW